MPFSSAHSTAPATSAALPEALDAAIAALDGEPTLAVAFYSPHHAANAAHLAEALQNRLPNCTTVGVLGESIVANSREIEDEPAISIWLASLHDDVMVDPFHLELEDAPDGPSLFGWPDAIMDADPGSSILLCFGDPYTFPAAELFLPRLNEDYPGILLSGGMASSPMGPNTPSLILNGEVKENGAVGVLLQGVRCRTIVSQGCRPVGKPLIITKGQDNVIAELGGQTPLEHMRGMLEEVSPEENALIQRGLLIGLAITENRQEFGRGDYLVRNLIGLDPRTGSLAVTDRIRRGQTVQFHVRDAQTAHEDLVEMLAAAPEGRGPAQAALLFSCNGRGTRLFGTPDHDASTVREILGEVPLAGFFAAGELGPVNRQNCIHGFTASVLVFE